MTWWDAEVTCQLRDSHLWAINSHEEYVLILKYLQNLEIGKDGFHLSSNDAILIGWNPRQVFFCLR